MSKLHWIARLPSKWADAAKEFQIARTWSRKIGGFKGTDIRVRSNGLIDQLFHPENKQPAGGHPELILRKICDKQLIFLFVVGILLYTVNQSFRHCMLIRRRWITNIIAADLQECGISWIGKHVCLKHITYVYSRLSLRLHVLNLVKVVASDKQSRTKDREWTDIHSRKHTTGLTFMLHPI